MNALQPWQRTSVFFVCLVLVLGSQSSSAEFSHADLGDYTVWAVRTGKVRLPQPSFDWSGPIMTYRFCDDSDSYGLNNSDPISIPLTEQFTVLAIRKYRNTQRQQQFWRPVLRQVEQEIAYMVSLINSGRFGRDELFAALSERSRRISDIYHTELTRLAQQEGKEGAKVREVKVCCACYPVKLQTIPPNGVIKYITAGSWSLYLFMTQERGVTNYPHPEWITIAQSESVTLTGKNWFSVKWPDGRKSMDLVTIENNRTLTFYPE